MALSDRSGLIWGVRLADAKYCDEDWLERLAADDPLWLHLDLADARARDWLKGRREIPAEACELLLGSEVRIHVELLPGAFAAVLGDLYHDFDFDPERLGVLRLYVDAKLVLSGRTHPLRSVDVLRRDLQGGSDVLTTTAVLQSLIEHLAGSLTKVASELAERVDDAEERILEGKFAGEGSSLGKLRRLVAKLRRLVGANRGALSSLPPALPGLYDLEEGKSLRSAIERLDAVGQDLELVQERARLLQEEIASNMNEATNRNLFVLSIMTTTLLPVTLITGIFGMNVRGLPVADHPHGFYWVMFFMGLTVLVALWVLRRVGAL